MAKLKTRLPWTAGVAPAKSSPACPPPLGEAKHEPVRKSSSRKPLARLWLLVILLLAHPPALLSQPAPEERLAEVYLKSGDAVLLAFAPLSKTLRHSIAKIDVNGSTVALAAIIDPGGLAVTKASELQEGQLTAWLPGGKEVPVEFLAADRENDVALIQVKGNGFQPVEWSSGEPAIGQWTLTAGIAPIPHAAGIISVPPRKILHKRAYIGVQLDIRASNALIERVMPGLGAEEAGLQAGDIILELDGAPIGDSQELMSKLREFRDGHVVKLRIKRAEEELEVEVEMRAESSERRIFGLSRQDIMNRLGGDVSERAEGFDQVIQHDTVLPPWLCGGPLFNLDGKAIGLNIARAGRTASYALPADLVRQIITRLRAQTAPGSPAETEE